jgi:phosphoglycerate dehydrogenase-like enzyme
MDSPERLTSRYLLSHPEPGKWSMTINVIFRGQVFGAELADLARRKGFRFRHAPDDAALLEELPHADALWITPSCYQPRVARMVCESAHKLKWLGLTSSGYDVIARLGAPSGVQVTYAAGVHAPTVAEHGIAMLMCLLRRFPETLAAQRQASWASGPLIATMRAMEDLSICVIGLGPVGQQLVRKLKVLAREVSAVTRSGQIRPGLAVRKFEDIDEVLPLVDAVFIAAPLTHETHNMFDRRRIGLLRRGSYLVNIARGANVDTNALDAALRRGDLAGAALDVTDPEPLPEAHPLWSAPNLLITPHVAAFGSIATGARLTEHLYRNLQRLATGEPLEGLVPEAAARAVGR